MSALAVLESERPLFDAIKKHEDLRAMARELGLQKANIQNRLATGRYIGEAGRQKLANHARDIEVTLGTVKRRAGEASVERQKAEQTLRRSACTLSPDADTSRRGSPTPAAVPESPELVAPSTYPDQTSPASNTLVLHVSDSALFAAGFALGLAAALIVCGICVGLAS